jgi:drug/metabolite transporter (DMT)-like permease
MTSPTTTAKASTHSLHMLGVACGLAAGAWLGAAEAPTKLVTAGLSPFLVSLGMVLGVFVGRWTVPMALKGTGYIWADLREKPHLIVWAILAGMLWAVANTLTVFAIRNVGLSTAFPLWNTNSLVGLFWGWLLFNELRGAAGIERAKVLGGAGAIVVGATIVAYATASRGSGAAHGAAVLGILAAVGAGVLWGTMYVPYRKAYISGMNPLSFVTVFTFGELGTAAALAAAFDGGWSGLAASVVRVRPALFWLFLGGFCWVLGDLFQQYAAKYIGISRGIPLSNTNQLWGLAWGALVFGEFAGQSGRSQALLIAGSLVMIAGVVAISFAGAAESEQRSWRTAMERECGRYGLDRARVAGAVEGRESAEEARPRRWWEFLIMAAAVALFVWLGAGAARQPIAVNVPWMAALLVASAAFLIGCGVLLWKRTRFT